MLACLVHAYWLAKEKVPYIVCMGSLTSKGGGRGQQMATLLEFKQSTLLTTQSSVDTEGDRTP